MDNSSDDNTDHDFVSSHCRVLKFTDLKGNTKEMYLPKSLDLERPKRSRTNFTLRQLNELEKAFEKNQYLVGKERKSLSERLELSEAQIKIWYQNRRTKHKKEKYKERQRMAANAESLAANNIMNLLQRQHFQRQDSLPMSSKPFISSVSQNSISNFKTICINNPMIETNVNPLDYNYVNCQWNSTNDYFKSIYLSPTLLHK